MTQPPPTRRHPLRSVVVPATLVLAGLVAARPGARPAGEEQEPVWGALSVDELIERLPPIGSEATWDDAQREWVPLPAVAELQRRLESGERLLDPQWRAALLRVGAIRVRERWPVDVPFAVSMHAPRWLPAGEIRMEPEPRTGLGPAKGGSLFWEMCGNAADSRIRGEHHQELGRLPLGHHRLTFDVTIERGDDLWRELRDEDGPPPGILWTGSMAFEVDVVPSVDAVLPPVRDAALDEAVAASTEGPRAPAGVALRGPRLHRGADALLGGRAALGGRAHAARRRALRQEAVARAAPLRLSSRRPPA